MARTLVTFEEEAVLTELVYLFRVAEDEELLQALCERLLLEVAPEWLSVSTLAPLTNFGYSEGVVGALLALHEAGLTYGCEKDPSVPRVFVPWQNIAYLADGDAMYRRQQEQAEMLARAEQAGE